MIRFRRFVTSVAGLAVVLVASSTQAFAGPSYSCKGDKRLDVPMQFAVSVQGSRVHLSASGGSDKSGWVVPSVWRLSDDRIGQASRLLPQGTARVRVRRRCLREANLEGLVPGVPYTIELTSVDFLQQSRSLPRQSAKSSTSHRPEPSAPNLSTPTRVLIGLQTGQFGQIQFSVTDDSGIRDRRLCRRHEDPAIHVLRRRQLSLVVRRLSC